MCTSLRRVGEIKDVFQLVRAEMLLVYADLFRRKSLLIMYFLWPYMLTGFILMFGYLAGSPHAFIEKVSVEPPIFIAVGSYLVFSTLSVIDDIMWRPIYDENLGTLPYIVASPTKMSIHYISIPIPRFVVSAIMGAAALFPILVIYRGLEGFLMSLIIVLLSLLSVAVFVPLATALGLGLYIAGGENWRAINFLRPLLLIMMGVYYPRWLMSLPLYITTSLLPPAHCVEVVQRIVVGLAEVHRLSILLTLAVVLGILYNPAMLRAAKIWEVKKLGEGVKT